MINKRLLFLSSSVAAMSLVLAGCDDKDENKEFESSGDCKSYIGDCTEVRNPVKLTEKNAPRFRSIQDCEVKFGQGNCIAPRDGKVSAVFATMDACESFYGENTCVFRKLPIAEADDQGRMVESGYVWTGQVNTDTRMETATDTGTVVAPLSSSGSTSSGGGGAAVYRPIITPYSFFYPYTYGYWGGSPWYTSPPPRVGGSYYTSSRAAALHPGTSGSFRGTLNSTSPGVGTRPNAVGVGANSSANRAGTVSSTPSAPRSGTVSSTGGSKGGGFGSTGSGASS